MRLLDGRSVGLTFLSRQMHTIWSRCGWEGAFPLRKVDVEAETTEN